MDLKSSFLSSAQARGFIHQGTDIKALDEKMQKETIVAYLGFDATATSLHVGNLVQLMLLRLLQKTGHKPIVLIGGGTTRAGDPSGKDEMRKILSPEQIDTNIQGILACFKKFLVFGDGPQDALLINNADWLLGINYLDFLREYGPLFSVNRMLTFDSVRLRLEREQPLSFLEFNYMILQAYDFLELYRRYGCSLQFGGADQWGNIINGVDLTRRKEQAAVYGMTTPLLTTADGAKMGKTARGAVWLHEDLLSPYEYWQFWRNTQDLDVGRFLRLFTELPLEEISKLECLQGAELNAAKKILADEATKLCHGEDAALKAHQAADLLFSGSPRQSEEGAPQYCVSKKQLEQGIPLIELLKDTKLASSNGEAKRLIQGRGVRLNDQVVEDDSIVVTLKNLENTVIKISAGKKRHFFISCPNE